MHHPLRRIALRSAFVSPSFAIAMALLLPGSGNANPPVDTTGLTRESFRRNCLMCHNKAAPEGISPEIMAGLTPTPGLRPYDAMPGLICWRRCDACKLPDRNKAKQP